MSWVPDSASRATPIPLAPVAVPLIALGAQALLLLSVPELSVDAEEAHRPIEVFTLPAGTEGPIPCLPTEAIVGLALVPLPMCIVWAGAPIVAIRNEPVPTHDPLHALVPLPVVVVGALAGEGEWVPELSLLALFHGGTAEPIPPCFGRALAGPPLWAVDPAALAPDADELIPEGPRGTCALVGGGIEVLPPCAMRDAASIPIVILPAVHAQVVGCWEGWLRTGCMAAAFEGEGVAWAIRAVAAHKEHVLVGEVAQESAAVVQVEEELGACPLRMEVHRLAGIQDDEPGDSEDPPVVPADVVLGGVADSGQIPALLGVGPMDDVELGLLPHDVADEGRMDLGDGREGKHDADARLVGLTVHDLDLEGRLLFLSVGGGADFEAMEKHMVVKSTGTHGAEGDHCLDCFAL